MKSLLININNFRREYLKHSGSILSEGVKIRAINNLIITPFRKDLRILKFEESILTNLEYLERVSNECFLSEDHSLLIKNEISNYLNK